MSDADTLIVFLEKEEQRLTYYSEQFDLGDFGGVLPNIGDLIVDPGVLAGLDRYIPKNRTVKEVVGRYFFPITSEKDTKKIALVVRSRPGTEFEEAALRGS